MAEDLDRIDILRERICEIGRRLYNKSYVSGTGGNISARLGGDRVLITPSCFNKGFLCAEEIAVVDHSGRDLVEGVGASSEKLVHLLFYGKLPAVGAVIHAHPPAATAHALAGLEIDCSCTPETVVFLGERVPLVPYETPSIQALPDAIAPFVEPCTRAYLMGNHGVVVVGRDLQDAYNNLETLELYARTLLYAKILGGARPIPPDKLRHLKEVFRL